MSELVLGLFLSLAGLLLLGMVLIMELFSPKSELSLQTGVIISFVAGFIMIVIGVYYIIKHYIGEK